MSLIRFSPQDLSSSSSQRPVLLAPSSTASHFTKLDSCQQRVCSLDSLYAKCIQYHVWKLLVWNSAPHLLLCLTILCPHSLPSSSGWTLLWNLSCFVCLSFFSVLSSVQLQPCLLCLFLSCTHLWVTIGPSVCEYMRGMSTMVHHWWLNPLQRTVKSIRPSDIQMYQEFLLIFSETRRCTNFSLLHTQFVSEEWLFKCSIKQWVWTVIFQWMNLLCRNSGRQPTGSVT